MAKDTFADALTESARTQKLDFKVISAADAAGVRGWLSTGNYAFNYAISGRFLRGYPYGHTVELGGDPSTGKSYLVANAIREVQALDGVVFLDDTEGAYNTDWTERLGVANKSVFYRRSRTVQHHEEAARVFLSAYKNVAAAKPGIMALDSIALLSTSHEMDKRLEKVDMSRAKEIRALFRLMLGDICDSNLVYLVTNHVTANIGDMFNPRETPGGSAPKYAASCRVDLFTPSKLKNSDSKYIGVKVTGVAIKTRHTVPWKRFSMVIPFYKPISPLSGLIDVMLREKVLETSGAHTLVWQGEDTKVKANKSDFFRQDKSAEELLAKVPNLLQEADDMLAVKEKALVPEDFDHEVAEEE